MWQWLAAGPVDSHLREELFARKAKAKRPLTYRQKAREIHNREKPLMCPEGDIQSLKKH